MKTHYTFSRLVKKVFLLIGISFLLEVNLYASEPVRYLITGVQNYDANGIYAQQGYYGENNWPYFKHEKANWFLYFDYYPAIEEMPFGGGYQPASGQWVLSTSLGGYPYFADYVDNVSYYVDPVSDEWYASGGGTLSIQLAEPYVNTLDATEIGSTVATLRAKVNSMDTNAHVYFVYGTSIINYTQAVHASVSPINGSEEVEISQEITGLLPNTTYYYRVEMSKQPYGTINGEGKTFQTTVSTDIDEVVENQFAVYPNPAKDGFYIDAKEQGYVCIYDLSGQLVLKQFIDAVSYIDIQSLAQGVYVVKLHERSRILLKTE